MGTSAYEDGEDHVYACFCMHIRCYGRLSFPAVYTFPSQDLHTYKKRTELKHRECREEVYLYPEFNLSLIYFDIHISTENGY